MTEYTIPILQIDSPFQQREQSLLQCTLKWRRKQLLIKLSHQVKCSQLPSVESEQWLVDCLKHSPVRLLRIDPELGEAWLKRWADACEQAKKPVLLLLPVSHTLPSKHHQMSWWVKRLMEWSAAVILLLSLSPLLLVIVWLMSVYSPGPILYRQWRVGQRGKLFRIIKFRTMVVDAEKLHHQLMVNQDGLHKLKDDPRITPLGRWMRKYSLDELPQLFNVIRGEMSLVGPRPWALYDALRISQEGQQRLNALPGITGPWQIQTRSNMLDLETVNNCDLQYLHTWSLWKDIKILTLTIPKVISGSGAY